MRKTGIAAALLFLVLLAGCVQPGPTGPEGSAGAPGASGDPAIPVDVLERLNLVRNLVITNGETPDRDPGDWNPDRMLWITADLLQVGTWFLPDLNLLAELEPGAAANTWYAVLVVTDGTNTSAMLTGADGQGVFTPPVTGDAVWRRVGWIRTIPEGANLYRIRQTNRHVHYLPKIATSQGNQQRRLIDGGTATAYALVDGMTAQTYHPRTLFPPGVREVFVESFVFIPDAEGTYAGAFWTHDGEGSPNGLDGDRRLALCASPPGLTAACQNNSWITLTPDQTFSYVMDIVGAGGGLYVSAEAYLDEGV